MMVRRFSARRRRRLRTGVPLAGVVVAAVGVATAMAAAISVPDSNVDRITNLPGPPPVTQTTAPVDSTAPSSSVVDTSTVDSSAVDSSTLDPSATSTSEPGASAPTP